MLRKSESWVYPTISPPVLNNIISCRILIPMLHIPAELFLSRACYGLTYSFVHFENVTKLICSLFWPKKLESSAERKKQKKLVSTFHLITRKRASETYLNDETMV
jgi:hypothetical protein